MTDSPQLPQWSVPRSATHVGTSGGDVPRRVPPPKRDQRPRPAPGDGASAHPAPRAMPRPPRRDRPLPIAPDPRPQSSGLDALKAQLRQVPPPLTPEAEPAPPSGIISRVVKNWTVWSLGSLGLVAGVATMSALSLFRIPNLPNCRAIFWPTAAASTRLQCAEAYADQGTVESLLSAIALVEALPEDHPLRSEINERVERWAQQILVIADRTFHEGDLKAAIGIARRIPRRTTAANQVAEQVKTWEDIWDQAESIFAASEGHIRALKFQEAFSQAIRLRGVGNTYWETTKYEELIGLITTAREDVNILGQAKRLADQGSSNAVIEALELVAQISPESYVYGEAQRLVKELSRTLLDLAEDALAQENGQRAREILGKIPPSAGLGAEVADFSTLADAYELTWAGTTVGYEAAITRLQSIGRDRPLYGRTQRLIQRWQQELAGVAQIDWARRISNPGTVADLRAAIAEAEKVDATNPRWEEAQDQIKRWRREISLIEDGPYLDQARALAQAGNREALEAAIATAGQLRSASALYEEAQALIADWRWEIQRMDNAPILARAQQQATAGNVSEAIEIASQIRSGQALYDDAQAAIALWQGQIAGSQQLQQAYRTAQRGTVPAFVEAIALAQAIPQTDQGWAVAQGAANQWSWDILRLAEVEASSNLSRGIAIAEQVPRRTEAYASAQVKLQEWRSILSTGSSSL